jgi:hypothetical protein
MNGRVLNLKVLGSLVIGLLALIGIGVGVAVSKHNSERNLQVRLSLPAISSSMEILLRMKGIAMQSRMQ